MTTPTKPIRLECDVEPSWIDAQTRLRVAAEFFGFPFHICMDEVAYAYKRRLDYVFERYEDQNISGDELKACFDWSAVYTREVNTIDEAMSVLYPWFHEGVKMEDAQ